MKLGTTELSLASLELVGDSAFLLIATKAAVAMAAVALLTYSVISLKGALSDIDTRTNIGKMFDELAGWAKKNVAKPLTNAMDWAGEKLSRVTPSAGPYGNAGAAYIGETGPQEIGRASCRERV